MVEVLEHHPDDAVLLEIIGLINSLNEDEKELVALMWMGRDDYDVEEWDQVRGEAAHAFNHRTARYLSGTPLLADYLASGLDKLGYSVSQLESEIF